MGNASPERFALNLSLSQQKENEFAQALNRMGFATSTSQNMGSFKEYDITATRSGSTVSFDVKFDMVAPRTGNVAVEVWKDDNGKLSRSGLSATRAHYYTYCFPTDPNFYVIRTKTLREMVNNKEFDNKVIGGNGKYFQIVLFSQAAFIKKCTVIEPFK
jgi:hypothetical protein